MKSIAFAPVALLGFAARQAAAHYTFPYVVNAGAESSAWQYIRQTQNFNSQGPVTDVTSPLFKCYENNTAAQTSVLTVQAGGTYTFRADGPIYHPGYLDVMMSAVSDPTSESAGSGATWFKVYEDAPVYAPSGSNYYTFPSQTSSDVTFTIPAGTPSGSYLVRVEQIALHVASSFGGAQFYLGCAEVKVTGGGSGTPGPLVSIPGVYTGNEPGILINIYGPNPNGRYISPGPAVWTGGSSGGGGGSTAVSPPQTTSKASAPTTSSSKSSAPSKTTTSAGGSTTGIAQYGQCGGQSYTGSTTCASPYKCVAENPYYSQCQ